MFYAIQTRLLDMQSGRETTVYNLRAYTDAEISARIRSAYSRGRTFSVQRVSEARRQAYVESIGRGEIRSHSTPPKQLMLLANAASMIAEEERKCDLFWN